MTQPWTTLAFSPKGRINRQVFWTLTAITTVINVAVSILGNLLQKIPDTASPIVVLPGALVVLGVSLVLLYVSIVVTIKRLHDRDRPGTFYLIVFIPIVGIVWLFIETGCLRGTTGRNRFGPDPLASDDDIVRVFDAPRAPPAIP